MVGVSATPRSEVLRLRRANNRRYAQARRSGLRDGSWRFREPADIAREHVARLRGWGLSVRAIAATSGLSESVVAPLYWPNHGAHRLWVLPATLDALAAVTSPLQAPAWAHVNAAGTRRRIGALMAIGWSQQEISQRLGVTRQAVSQMKRADKVSVANALLIARVYDELSMTPGTDARAKTWASAAGYASPLAWDDDSIDDPAATPVTGLTADVGVDHAVVHRVLCGEPCDTTTADRVVIVPRLAELGMSDAAIAALCRTAERTVYRTRQRLGVESRWAA